MRTLIGQGANFLIIGSADYQDAMIEISEEYPDVKFLYLANLLDQPYPNIMTTEYAENEGAFLLGALAGMLTKTNNVGTVAAVKGDSVQEKYTWGFPPARNTPIAILPCRTGSPTVMRTSTLAMKSQQSCTKECRHRQLLCGCL